jgi:hypothetical protein
MPESEPKPPQNPPGRPSFGAPGNVPMPIFYFNGFALQYGTGDFTLILKVDDAQQIALKMSYTVGKTLSQALVKLVDDFERITSHDVMTSEEVRNSIQAEKVHAPSRSVKPAE